MLQLCQLLFLDLQVVLQPLRDCGIGFTDFLLPFIYNKNSQLIKLFKAQKSQCPSIQNT